MRDVSTELGRVVRGGIDAGVFPTAEATAWREGVAHGAFSTAGGRFFDLASLTKPFVASVAARLHARGALRLDESVLLLLAHRSGLPAWKPYYEKLRGDDVVRAALAEPRDTEPGAREVYSDVGYLVLGALLEDVGGAPLDRLVADEVTGPLGIADVRYGPIEPDLAVPTEDCPWRRKVLRGEVHDDNAFALGRPAPHAGLFGRAEGVLAFGRAWLDALAGRSAWLPRDVATLFVNAPPGGTHSPAWDTRAPPPEGSSAGTRLGRRSFGHLGFTGTSIWCDPDAYAVVVLLSNRVHPTRANEAIRQYRPRFHDEVAALLEI